MSVPCPAETPKMKEYVCLSVLQIICPDCLSQAPSPNRVLWDRLFPSQTLCSGLRPHLQSGGHEERGPGLPWVEQKPSSGGGDGPPEVWGGVGVSGPEPGLRCPQRCHEGVWESHSGWPVGEHGAGQLGARQARPQILISVRRSAARAPWGLAPGPDGEAAVSAGPKVTDVGSTSSGSWHL